MVGFSVVTSSLAGNQGCGALDSKAGEPLKKILLVAGARPNFMKLAPIVAALKQRGTFRQILVHTGQHYDDALSQVFFHELGIPQPDINL